MFEYKFSAAGYSPSQIELYKKSSGIDPIKKAQAKQLINSKIASRANLSNSFNKSG